MKSRKFPEKDIAKINIVKRTPEELEEQQEREAYEKAERERRSKIN